jgi:Raf kinase inhibitor-like YbhB/YbcL family protein
MKTRLTTALFFLAAFGGAALLVALAPSQAAGKLSLTAPAYHGGHIPQRFTCDGKGVSPPLKWQGVPKNAKSLALTIVDPDASGYVHWVLYDLPPSAASLPEGASPSKVPKSARHGLNSRLTPRFHPFCPPHGLHHYVHMLYALDTKLPDLHQPTRKALDAAMQGHVIAKAKLVATYTRGGNG